MTSTESALGRPLSTDELTAFEARFCRSSKREVWWRPQCEDYRSTLGVMLKDAISTYNDVTRASKEGRVTQRALWESLAECGRVGHPKFNEFLNGTASRTYNWTKFARAGLENLLLGYPRHALEEDQELIAKRVVEFFFPRSTEQLDSEQTAPPVNKDTTWFFDHRLRSYPTFATTSEAIAEMRAMAYELATEEIQAARLFRTSGSRPFVQTDLKNQRLTDYGLATLEGLEAGIGSTFVFPTGNHTDAAASAKFLKEAAKERFGAKSKEYKLLQLCPVDPEATIVDESGEKFWAGEFLSKVHTHVLYVRELGMSADRLDMLVCRSPEHGSCAFSPDETELRNFRAWQKVFAG